MKKWIALLLSLTLMFVFVGCGGGGTDTPDEPTGITPTALEITGSKESLNVGETLKLDVEFTPTNATNKNVTWRSSNEAVIKVDSSGTVTAAGAGTATITATSRAASTVTATVTITVTAVHVDITGLTISGNAEVEVGRSIFLQAAATPTGASNDATWETSDATIATVETSGRVTGIKEGTVTITATSTENTSIKAEHSVTVKAATEQSGTAPTSILVETSENTVYTGRTIKFNATVYPEEANQNVTWISRNPERATVDEKGVITGVAPGVTFIYAVSVVDESVQSEYIRITVEEKIEIVKTYPDLQGYVVKMMYHNTFNPFSERYTSSDKSYKQQAITEIKTLYNVDFEFMTYGEDASWGPNRVTWINSQAESGTAPADFYDVTVGWIKQLVDGGAVVDLTGYYTKWGEGSMTITEKMAATVRGKLYGVSTGESKTAINVDIGLFYNYGMLKNYNIESPAKLFNEGKWTYSEFVAWVKSAQALLPEGTFTLAGHPYYYWFGMINAGGIKLTDTASVKVNVKHAYAREAANILRSIYVEGAYETTPTWAESDGAFMEGKSLVSSGCVWFVRHTARWTPTVWGEGSTEFGYVPLPWPDNKTKEETRISSGGDTAYVMAVRQRPAYVDDETLYQVLQDYYLLAIDYQEADPSYDPESVLVQYAESKFDDPESVEAFLYMNDINKMMFDPGHAFFDSTSGSPMTGNLINIVQNGADFDQEMDEDMDSYQARFLSYYA